MTNSIRIDSQHSLEEMVRSAMKYVLPGLRNEVNWQFKEDRICLNGVVSSYYEKQIAQEALLKMPGLGTVENNLCVSR